MAAIHVAVGVIVNGRGEVLIARRPQHKHQGGLWEFPGGKVEPGEAVEGALGRELAEELGIVVTRSQPFLRVDHAYADKQVSLDVWLVSGFSGTALGREGQSVRWVPKTDLWRYPFPAANRPILCKIALPELAVVTGAFTDLADFELRLRRAIDRGAGLVYLRLRPLALQDKALLHRIRAACDELPVPVCVSPGWAERLGSVDALHLSAADLWNSAPREQLNYRLVGASCHNERELAQASSLGVDYIFLSPVRRTQSHPDRLPLGLEHFGRLSSTVKIPVYGLGGLGPLDLPSIQQRGGFGIAAISALWD